MTILTTTGNAGPLLAVELATLGLSGSQIDNLVQQVIDAALAAGATIEAGGITPDPTSTSKQLKFNLTDPGATGLVTVDGSGFGNSSGAIRNITFDPVDPDQLGWRAATRGKWNADSVSIRSVSSIEMFNDDRSTSYALTGNFKLADDRDDEGDDSNDDAGLVSGKIRSMTAKSGGYTLDMKGRIDVNDLTDGHINRLVLSDGDGNQLEARGKIAAAALFGPDVTATSIADYFDNAALWAGNDKLTVTSNARAWNGFAGNDVMKGGDAADTLLGGDGNDQLSGGAGDDVLVGGAGRDKLAGGAGADNFVLNAIETGGGDRIRDFRASDGDKIVLDTAVFTALAGGLAGSFVAGNGVSAVDANDFLLFDTSKGRLYYDADGNGSGAAVEIATLSGVKDLSETDLQII